MNFNPKYQKYSNKADESKSLVMVMDSGHIIALNNDAEHQVYDCDYGNISNIITYQQRTNLFVSSSIGLLNLDLSKIKSGDASCSQVITKSFSATGLPDEGKNLLDVTIADGNIYVLTQSNHQVYKLAMDQLESGTWSQLTSPYPINYIVASEDGNYLYAVADNGSFLIHGVIVNHF